MAIKIHEYFKHEQRKALATVAIIQLLGAFFAGIFLWMIWDHSISGITSFVVTAAALVAAINLITVPLILWVVSKPTHTLAQAIAHVSKDPVVTQPPVLTKADERSGLKDLVQVVYELAVASPPAAKPAESAQADQPEQPAEPSDFFKHMADITPCGIIVIDTKGKVSYANQIAPTSPTPAGDRSVDLIFEQTNNLTTWLTEARTNKVRDVHTWLRVGDKLPSEEGRRIFDVVAYYQKNDPSGIEAVIVTFDRTAVYNNDQEDMDFIALAAHELRGPITVIRGYLDVFNQEVGDKLEPDQQQLLERLRVSSERLASYVSNILNVSRYDRHQFALHPQEESLTELIRGLGSDLILRAKTQNRSLVFNIPKELPTVAVDSSSMGEVVTNLVDNAIKYSRDRGEVVVAATHKENWVEITVTDQGIGMPAAIVGNLFNRFYRSHRSKEQVGGTGLGLYICKTIVEAHGGTIWVRSIEGKGSTFGFTIPTYASVADKLQNGNNNNQGIVRRPEGWIKNHAMYRG